MSPISMGLQDRHHYVRRTAVLGVLKVYNLDASAVRNAGGLCFSRGLAELAAVKHGRLSAHPCIALGCMVPAVGGVHVVKAEMRCCRGLELTSIARIRVLAPCQGACQLSPVSHHLHQLTVCSLLLCIVPIGLCGNMSIDAGMLEDLKTMLQQDPDAQVVANCMSVLLAVSKLVKWLLQLHAAPGTPGVLPAGGHVSLTSALSAVWNPSSSRLLCLPLLVIWHQPLQCLLQTGSGQSLLSRGLVISLLNRIKASCWLVASSRWQSWHPHQPIDSAQCPVTLPAHSTTGDFGISAWRHWTAFPCAGPSLCKKVAEPAYCQLLASTLALCCAGLF